MTVSIEPLAASHAVEMVEVLADPALYAFTGGSPPDLAELSERFDRQTRGSGRLGERWLNWVVRVEGTAVGSVQATVMGEDEAAVAILAWLVSPPSQGQGIATAATRLAIARLRADGVGGFRAHIAEGHAASEAVARKLGLAVTAELVDGERVWASTPG